mmetsp:Transcript_3180/g.4924  ORF Transcript_3180/g.4924 Transcript_3180/m.4924 type:complete len:201 (-) Transcript_3180:621-1223(-)
MFSHTILVGRDGLAVHRLKRCWNNLHKVTVHSVNIPHGPGGAFQRVNDAWNVLPESQNFDQVSGVELLEGALDDGERVGRFAAGSLAFGREVDVAPRLAQLHVAAQRTAFLWLVFSFVGFFLADHFRELDPPFVALRNVVLDKVPPFQAKLFLHLITSIAAVACFSCSKTISAIDAFLRKNAGSLFFQHHLGCDFGFLAN